MKRIGTASDAGRTDGDAVPPLAIDPETEEELVRRVRARRARPEAGWFGSALSWNRSLSADADLIARAERLGREGGAVVLTGQQVGLFGGPLYSLYKLLSAVELAAWLEERSGVPVIPVFWLVGDDSDFGEVASIAFPDGLGRPQRIRDADPPAGGTLTGGLSAERHRRPLAELRGLLAAWPHGGLVAQRIEAALALAHTWSDLHASLYHLALGPRGALFVDGAADALLHTAGPWLAEAAEAPLAALLAEAAAAATLPGSEPPLDPGLGERALFRIAAGRREPLPAVSSARDAIAAGDRLAPNVVLRPVLQDHLLPNVATICGPSEIRYRRQLGPIYARLGVPEPLRPARFGAVLVPALPGLGALPEAALGEAAHDPVAFVDSRVTAELPAELLVPLAELREHVRAEIERLDPRFAAYDRSLPQLVASAAGKADYQFERMLEGVRAKARHQLFQREPLLAALADLVVPRERPQERSLSFWFPLAAEGDAVLDLLAEAARAHGLGAARAALRDSGMAFVGSGGGDGGLGHAVFRLDGQPTGTGVRP